MNTAHTFIRRLRPVQAFLRFTHKNSLLVWHVEVLLQSWVRDSLPSLAALSLHRPRHLMYLCVLNINLLLNVVTLFAPRYLLLSHLLLAFLKQSFEPYDLVISLLRMSF